MPPRLNSLGFRLLLGYLLPLLLFGAAALVAYLTIHRLLAALESEQRTTQILAEGYRLKEGIAGMAADKTTHHLLGDRDFRERFEERHADAVQSLGALRRLLGDQPAQAAELTAVADLLRKWRDLAEQDFRLFDGGALNAIVARLQLRPAVKLHTEIRDRMDRLLAAEAARLQALEREVQDTTRESVWAITASSLLAFALSFLAGRLLAWGVARPIQELREAAARLHKGQFQVVTPSGPAEIVELTRALNLMGLALTEREALLQSSEHRYRAVVGSTSTLLWTADAAGHVTDLARWRAFTGQEEAQLGDGGWLDAVHPDDREALGRAWADTLAGRDPPEQEARVRRADGVYRAFRCRGVPVRDAQGQVLEWVNVCADVTERKEEEALRKEKEAAEAASRAKSDFLAKMSHELRTPLNAVIGMSKMLSTRRFGPLTDKQADYLGDITGAGEHLLRLINDILDLSKVEAGRMELAPEPVQAGATVTAAVSALRALAEGKGLRLTCTAPEPDGLIVTDPARFKQVLFNLVSNAVKFTERGGVSVRCAWADGPGPGAAVTGRTGAAAVRVEVEDSGAGIDPQDHAKVGREFYQGRGGPGRAAEGTGLGLALTRRLVELMGGEFWFTSAPGRGSCFAFGLPLRAPLPEAASASDGLAG